MGFLGRNERGPDGCGSMRALTAQDTMAHWSGARFLSSSPVFLCGLRWPQVSGAVSKRSSQEFCVAGGRQSRVPAPVSWRCTPQLATSLAMAVLTAAGAAATVPLAALLGRTATTGKIAVSIRELQEFRWSSDSKNGCSPHGS